MFVDYFGLDYSITQNPVLFEQHESLKINYSTQKFIKEGIKIIPAGLLFEFGIKDHHIEVHNHDKFHKLFFKSSGHLPFDLFSSAFWLLSRYEEYLPFKQDKYNRFDVKNSLAFQYDFIQTPLVNLWLEEFKKIIIEQYPKTIVTQHRFNFLSTIDIDNAYKFKFKGIMRSMGGFLKSLMEFDLKSIKERAKVVFNLSVDPFDSYKFLLDIQKKYGINSMYFFLLGDYGVNDKNHPANNKDFQVLIKHLADYSQIGIHPSYKSNNNLNQLRFEINRLANITHRDIKNSRQHFSMMSFPETYQALLQSGILHDYSMGYGNYNGFRASYCMPYNWYDLDSEQETNLVVHSFCVVETTLKFNNKAKSADALDFALPYIKQVKKYNGEFISIFHNDTMGSAKEWEGWQKVYEQIGFWENLL